jgi:hypothetical protein
MAKTAQRKLFGSGAPVRGSVSAGNGNGNGNGNGDRSETAETAGD